MWRFKPFMHKDQAGLEGRSMDVGNLKIQIQKAIAEGGFSCVYLARDTVHVSKQYALKHMICNDEESLDLIMKEITVMKALRGHPNVVTLCAHTILDMGRTKEAYLVMEFCEKSLVSVLESRGSGYFDEKQVLLIFRDVCNAVFAMHCQSPPIAHRDLKAENLLLGSDGSWKLCDFGSTSTNHKRFEKPEEMGIEEDNIRKHTTPAYRSPEMWDLYRRDVISEKVDIWALGCLLFRVCYFKSAFDGESKLQILNGNYRIPELPKYSSLITDLIRDMLQASPDDRPDITQVWFRVNIQLPEALQKPVPDRPPEMHSTEIQGNSRHSNKSTMPRRSPPPPPQSGEPSRDPFQHSVPSKPGNGAGQLGAFWSTQHAHNNPSTEDKNEPKFDEEPTRHENRRHSTNSVLGKEDRTQTRTPQKNSHQPVKDFDVSFFQKASLGNSESSKDEAFNSFVAEFDVKKLGPESNNYKKSSTEQALEAQVDSLKGQLKEANSEKAEIASKFEKLSAICRAQRLEIQELKQAMSSKTPSPNKEAFKHQASPGTRSPAPSPQTDKFEGNVREIHEKTPESKTWQAFAEESKPQQSASKSIASKSVRTRNGQHNSPQTSQPVSGFDLDSWGFGTESFTALPSGGSQVPRPLANRNDSPSTGAGNKPGSQPAGWAGF